MIKDGELYDLLKIVILGDSGVGKTNIISQYIENSFLLGSISTIGVEFYTKKLFINNKNIFVQLWDTAGQERFRCIVSNYYRKSNGILLVYDISDQYSFDNIIGWLNDIASETNYSVPILLIGNKLDLEAKCVISTEQGKELANKFGIEFTEMSALTNTGVSMGINNFIEHVHIHYSHSNANGNNTKKNTSFNITNLESKNKCC
jgi:small GTP-binding protein